MPEFEFLQQLTPYLLGLGLVGLFLLAVVRVPVDDLRRLHRRMDPSSGHCS